MTILPTSLPHSYPTQGFTSTHIHRALNSWHNGGIAASGLDALYLVQQARANSTESTRYVDNQLLHEALTDLAQVNREHAEILQLRFLDNIKAETLANQLNLASSTFFERQKTALESLATILSDRDLDARRQRYEALERLLARRQRLHLVGIEHYITAVSTQLTQSNQVWIVSLEGIGGIGKTTVAGEAARHVLWHDLSWEQVAWITAKPAEFTPEDAGQALETSALTADSLLEQLYAQLVTHNAPSSSPHGDLLLTALEEYLRDRKTLIIIDNLETLLDVERLLPTLSRLCNPSKFILTSRENFYTEEDIYHISLNELKEQDAIELVRAEAHANNLMEVVTAKDEHLRPIYETVGGNPLALRLVVGQLHIFDLGQVLDDLKEARGKSAESIYTFIFRWAWEHLDEATRQLFIAMLLTSDAGDTFDELQALCCDDVSHSELRAGIKQLVLLNLVESRGNIFERRYSIHNLTRSFLHRQVKLWQEAT